MTIKIENKIVDYGVKSEDTAPTSTSEETAKDNVIQMHEKLERPDVLVGSTYKIKTPLSEHAMYITINDIVLNQGTEQEQRRPFEVFINSKNMENFQWILALTRIISAVFRKGGDVTFLVEELHSVFDPRGGYFKRGGKYMPSLVAEIGDAVEAHLRMIGMLPDDDLDDHQRAFIEQKRAEHAAFTDGPASVADAKLNSPSDFPDNAQLCSRCHTKAVIQMDGCMTCLNCGDSKCG